MRLIPAAGLLVSVLYVPNVQANSLVPNRKTRPKHEMSFSLPEVVEIRNSAPYLTDLYSGKYRVELSLKNLTKKTLSLSLKVDGKNVRNGQTIIRLRIGETVRHSINFSADPNADSSNLLEDAIPAWLRIDTPGVKTQRTLIGYLAYSGGTTEKRTMADYVTENDPNVIELTKRVFASVGMKTSANATPPQRLLLIKKVHELLKAYGLRYERDPHNPDILDRDKFGFYIQQPSATLTYNGDCEDLSILYASIFRQFGWDYRLVSTEAHTAVMADLGVTLARAKKALGESARMLVGLDRFGSITESGKARAWLPLEPSVHGEDDDFFLEMNRQGKQFVKDSLKHKDPIRLGLKIEGPQHKTVGSLPPCLISKARIVFPDADSGQHFSMLHSRPKTDRNKVKAAQRLMKKTASRFSSFY